MDHSDSQAGGGIESAGAALRLPEFDPANDLDKQRHAFDAFSGTEAHYRAACAGFDNVIALNPQTQRNLEQRDVKPK